MISGVEFNHEWAEVLYVDAVPLAIHSLFEIRDWISGVMRVNLLQGPIKGIPYFYQYKVYCEKTLR